MIAMAHLPFEGWEGGGEEKPFEPILVTQCQALHNANTVKCKHYREGYVPL